MIVDVYLSTRSLTQRIEGRDPYVWSSTPVESFAPIPASSEWRETGVLEVAEAREPAHSIYCPPGSKVEEKAGGLRVYVPGPGFLDPPGLLTVARTRSFGCYLAGDSHEGEEGPPFELPPAKPARAKKAKPVPPVEVPRPVPPPPPVNPKLAPVKPPKVAGFLFD